MTMKTPPVVRSTNSSFVCSARETLTSVTRFEPATPPSGAYWHNRDSATDDIDNNMTRKLRYFLNYYSYSAQILWYLQIIVTLDRYTDADFFWIPVNPLNTC